MSNPRRIRYIMGRIALILILLAVTVFAAERCLFRAPDQKETSTTPDQISPTPESNTDAEKEANDIIDKLEKGLL